MFLEKLLVIEATYTATEHKLRVEEKSVLGNPIGNSLYTARNYFSLREITFLYTCKRNRETMVTVLVREKLTIRSNFNEKLRPPLPPFQ